MEINRLLFTVYLFLRRLDCYVSLRHPASFKWFRSHPIHLGHPKAKPAAEGHTGSKEQSLEERSFVSLLFKLAQKCFGNNPANFLVQATSCCWNTCPTGCSLSKSSYP